DAKIKDIDGITIAFEATEDCLLHGFVVFGVRYEHDDNRARSEGLDLPAYTASKTTPAKDEFKPEPVTAFNEQSVATGGDAFVTRSEFTVNRTLDELSASHARETALLKEIIKIQTEYAAMKELNEQGDYETVDRWLAEVKVRAQIDERLGKLVWIIETRTLIVDGDDKSHIVSWCIEKLIARSDLFRSFHETVESYAERDDQEYEDILYAGENIYDKFCNVAHSLDVLAEIDPFQLSELEVNFIKSLLRWDGNTSWQPW
ncbi:hypothetical protein HDV00_004848, partial [Rhizophlyctis rosea]